MGIKISDLYTKVSTEAYGTMEFSGLRDKDIRWLSEAQTETLAARDFTAHLVQNQLITPQLDFETVDGWLDDFLLFVASEWLKHQRYGKALKSASSFEEFKEGVYTHKDELMVGSRELFEAFSTNLKSVMTPILSEIGSAGTLLTHLSDYTDLYLNQASAATQLATGWRSQMDGVITSIESVTKDLYASTSLINDAIADIGVNKLGYTVSELVAQSIFDSLPDFTDWEEIAKEMRESDQAFRASGYSFIAQFISYESVRSFASINIKVRNAAITNTMTATTRQKEFEEQLRKTFQRSPVLSRRWKIVKQALDAHRERKYNLSVPVL